ncbi:microtubule-associated protein 1S-like [Sorghum bicolor]|uniref:microtubule-associated protein 1S-like n=1 Tax=Sorghum bicolor TaxID=4558 RepID=UPI000B426C6A|nr:microtubule-associated protein 1S-like [Sorghum bicolor]|eukprot:XP_021307804.1 microtubule-associated protein 1S-like [Sorghum bicolor]
MTSLLTASVNTIRNLKIESKFLRLHRIQAQDATHPPWPTLAARPALPGRRRRRLGWTEPHPRPSCSVRAPASTAACPAADTDAEDRRLHPEALTLVYKSSSSRSPFFFRAPATAIADSELRPSPPSAVRSLALTRPRPRPRRAQDAVHPRRAEPRPHDAVDRATDTARRAPVRAPSPSTRCAPSPRCHVPGSSSRSLAPLRTSPTTKTPSSSNVGRDPDEAPLDVAHGPCRGHAEPWPNPDDHGRLRGRPSAAKPPLGAPRRQAPLGAPATHDTEQQQNRGFELAAVITLSASCDVARAPGRVLAAVTTSCPCRRAVPELRHRDRYLDAPSPSLPLPS